MRKRGSVKDSIFTSPRTPYTPTMRPSSTRRPSVAASMVLRRSLLAGFLHQQLHLVRALRALADPFLDLGDVQLQTLVRTGSARIEVTQTRDVAAVAGVALVGHHHVVERPALRACARKTNFDHKLCSGDSGRLSRHFALHAPTTPIKSIRHGFDRPLDSRGLRSRARLRGRGKRAIVAEMAGKARDQG